MTTHRFNGVPINIDALSSAELENLHGYISERAAQALGELAVLDNWLQPTIEFPAVQLPGFEVA